MNPQRWARVKAVFQVAVDLAATERAAYLDSACAADGELRDEVESLIAAHEAAGAFIEGAPQIDIAEMLEGDVARCDAALGPRGKL